MPIASIAAKGRKMSLKIAVQMDPIQRINIKGDSTFALLLEAQKRGHRLAHYTPDRLAMLNGRVFAHVESLTVRDRPATTSRSMGRGAWI
jgi:glutathione synthase